MAAFHRQVRLYLSDDDDDDNYYYYIIRLFYFFVTHFSIRNVNDWIPSLDQAVRRCNEEGQ